MIRRLCSEVPLSILLALLAGCATHIGAPQTEQEFITLMKGKGLFRNAETYNVARPLKPVVADMTAYAERCLKARTSRAPNYMTKESGGTTNYRPKVQTGANGVTTLAVQEIYNNREESGAPPGGMYTFAAEARAAGGATQVDVYYLSNRAAMAQWLKRWVEGDKARCPALE